MKDEKKILKEITAENIQEKIEEKQEPVPSTHRSQAFFHQTHYNLSEKLESTKQDQHLSKDECEKKFKELLESVKLICNGRARSSSNAQQKTMPTSSPAPIVIVYSPQVTSFRAKKKNP